MGWTFYNASGQQLRNTGTVLATQAEMETGTALTSFVTPGRTQYHPGVSKGYCRITATGSLVAGSHNVSSVTDNGTGDYTVVWDTDFSNGNYSAPAQSADSGVQFIRCDNYATGSVQIFSRDAGDSAASDSATNIAAFGDQ